MNLSFEDCMPDPPIDKEKERRKGKAAIMKKARKQSSHHMLGHLKRANYLEVKVLKVREDLLAEINHLQAMTAKAECLAREKIAESESLHNALRREEFILVRLKAALALEEKEKKEAKLKGHNLQSPINADFLPQGVPLKPLIKSLKKKIHHLKKKLKRMEEGLQSSQKKTSKVTKEVTRLQNLHMKDSADFDIQKGIFKKELAELKKNASCKS
ncbi:hypothetical protein COCNU_scaffold000483G000010 [Cocos nucifera]|nr:hypothetical protein [Cocos nucifera]